VVTESNADERWLDAFAGRMPSVGNDLTDTEIVKIGQIRGYFEMRNSIERALIPSDASEARLLARIRSQFQTDLAPDRRLRQAPVAGQDVPSRLGRFMDWLLPPTGNLNGRYAVVAGLAMAAAFLPALLQPPRVQDVAEKRLVIVPFSLQRVLVSVPAQTAEQLRLALARAGVQAQVHPGANGVHTVSATVGANLRARVLDQLGPWGLTVPENGQLVIQVYGTE
jgi:hypothetical protein